MYHLYHQSLFQYIPIFYFISDNEQITVMINGNSWNEDDDIKIIELNFCGNCDRRFIADGTNENEVYNIRKQKWFCNTKCEQLRIGGRFRYNH